MDGVCVVCELLMMCVFDVLDVLVFWCLCVDDVVVGVVVGVVCVVVGYLFDMVKVFV